MSFVFIIVKGRKMILTVSVVHIQKIKWTLISFKQIDNSYLSEYLNPSCREPSEQIGYSLESSLLHITHDS